MYGIRNNRLMLAEVKHTRSSYSSRDDRQAFDSFIVDSKIIQNATFKKIIAFESDCWCYCFAILKIVSAYCAFVIQDI